MNDEITPSEKVDLAILRAAHQKKYQAMIDYIKARVGEGTEYRNGIARVVVSETGAYCELNDLAEEFTGAAGAAVQRRFVKPAEAFDLVTRAAAAIPLIRSDNTRHFALFCLYSRRGLVDSKDCYIYEYRASESDPQPAPLEIGVFRPDVIPGFFKVRVDADLAQEVLDLPRGVVFSIANTRERHLQVFVPFDESTVTDLNEAPGGDIVQ